MGRGQLRIYVGYTSGVGITCAMLEEGHRRRERGTDVVIGVVDDHGRERTRRRLEGLEMVPPRVVDGVTEMDLDAVLRRAPGVALVDDLWCRNALGERTAARWQDVEELVAAGIDVVATVNIQHVESLRDVVERILGSAPVDRVPDRVVRAADQLEIVDITPQALLRRLAHGNIFPAERIDAAFAGAFAADALGALRELSLLWMADRVQETLRDVSLAAAKVRERVLVAVSGADDDDLLVRRAARIAQRRGAELVAVHVAPGSLGGRARSLDGTRSVVEAVGGRLDEVVAADVVSGLLDAARAQEATVLVVGTHPSRRPSIGRSPARSLVRAAPSADVHVVTLTASVPERLLLRRPPGLPVERRLLGLIGGAIVLLVLTVAVDRVHDRLGLSSILLLYLTVVVGVAAVGGLWPAVTAAVGSTLIINWFFTPPLHTWTIAAPEHVLGLAVFLLVAGVVSVLVDRDARARADAERGRVEAEALARLAARLAAEDDPLPGLLDHLRSSFGLEAAAVLRADTNGGWEPEAVVGDDPPTEPDRGTDVIELGPGSVLVVRGAHVPADSLRVLSAFTAQLQVAVRARILAREAAEASALAEVGALRTAILAAVSHDLRTPLASIKASVSSLRDDEVVWSAEETDDFLETIEEETDRLTELVGNLLDMSRLTSGSLVLVRRVVGLDEVVPKALASLSNGARVIRAEVPETLPRVDVDPGLLERAVANVAANALSWNRGETPVQIRGSAADGRVELRVIDRGPGVARGDHERIFEPFQRLGDRSRDGVGLGLAVARGFVEAMGGRIAAEDTPGGGLTMVLSFPEAVS